MITLYDDQESALKSILAHYRQGYRSVLLVAPCGYGKTIVFSAIAKRAKSKGNRVIICVHRQELLRQVCETLKRFDVSFGVIAAGYPETPDELIQIASIQTLYRRLHKIKLPRLLIIDEAHHSIAKTFHLVIQHFHCKILGVTATPWRSDGSGLDMIFDCMIIGGTADDLIQRGRLCKPVYYAPPQVAEFDDVKITMGDYDKKEIDKRVNKPVVTGDAIQHYRKICDGKRAVVFCVSRKHSDDVAEQFNSAGIPAKSIDGSLSSEERLQRVNDLRDGVIKVLTSCELISEGFDLPTIEASIMLRPTQSLAIHIQQAGRALRIAEGKTEAFIVDCVGNLWRHGAIEDINDWTLEGISKRVKNKEYIPSLKRCKKCFVVLPASANVCRECGSELEVSTRELKHIEGELKRLEAENLKAIKEQRKQERRTARSFDDLVAIGVNRGYKSPVYWARCVIEGRKSKRS